MTRVAAVDCGTNSIRLLVADLDGGRPPVDVLRRMEIVRLGQGVDATGRLAPDALARTRTVLEEYAALIGSLAARRVRMVATSATRDATNAGSFREMVLDTLGVPPEVVSGEEEARLSFAGAVCDLPPGAEAPYLVVDIGGGSTEFVRGAAAGPEAVRSVNVGCVRMTERHLRSDPPTAAEIATATADVERAVDEAVREVSGGTSRTLVGLAGSVTTVTALALGLPAYDPVAVHHARVAYPAVAKLAADLLGMTRAQRLALPAMHPGRADVIGAGALILRIVMERVGASSVVASERDILDGLALSMAPPAPPGRTPLRPA